MRTTRIQLVTISTDVTPPSFRVSLIAFPVYFFETQEETGYFLHQHVYDLSKNIDHVADFVDVVDPLVVLSSPLKY